MKLINSNDILQLKKHKKSFLEFILPFHDILEVLFEKDSLLIYSIIDFFDINVNLIEDRKNNIQFFLNENNINFMEKIWNVLSCVEFNHKDINENLIEHITLNEDKYFSYLINESWIKKHNNTFFQLSNDNMIILTKQLLLSYYYNIYNKRSLGDLNIYDDGYQEFLKILIKYEDVYTIENNKIIFIDIYTNQNMSDVVLEKKDILKLFFLFCLEKNVTNKNLIMWYYILYKDEIPIEFGNDFFYIILDINYNISGFVSKILNYVGVNFYELDKTIFDDFIENVNKSHDYIYKMGEEINIENYIMDDLINNKFILEDIKKIKNNIENVYFFLKDINLLNLNIYSFYVFLITSPLNGCRETQMYNVINTTEIISNNIILPEFYKIFNSISCSKFKGKCVLFDNQNNIFHIDNIQNFELDLSLFDTNIMLFFYIIFSIV